MSLRIHGNRQLKTLPGQDTRPTASMVRQAVFNIWQDRISGCRWLDLCAGSGAMGAEALCRRAALVIGIEQSARACTVVRENWQKVARADQTFQIIRGDVVRQLITLAGQSFDRIYFDPPYTSDLYQPVITLIAQQHILAPNGELAVEHSRDRLDRSIPASLQICRQKVYGSTCLTFYRHTDD